MIDRRKFAEGISQIDLTKTEQAIAFLWFYRITQAYEERTAKELAEDLTDEGLGRPNVTRLNEELTRSKFVIKGKRKKTFQLHTKYIPELNEKYGSLVNFKKIDVTPSIIPFEFVQGTRQYLEEMVRQINGAYDCGFCDACAVIIRRLMESLIIEVFIKNKRENEIRINNKFIMLDDLIKKISNHAEIRLSRNTSKSMEKIRNVGDTAAHDRTYIIQSQDIDDIKFDVRKTIKELLVLANIQPKLK